MRSPRRITRNHAGAAVDRCSGSSLFAPEVRRPMVEVVDLARIRDGWRILIDEPPRLVTGFAGHEPCFRWCAVAYEATRS